MTWTEDFKVEVLLVRVLSWNSKSVMYRCWKVLAAIIVSYASDGFETAARTTYQRRLS